MSLPLPAARTQLHSRDIVLAGYKRDDGHWDLEAALRDSRGYSKFAFDKGIIKAGEPIHDMAIRITVDDSMTVREVAASMSSVPFLECQRVVEPLQQMLGAVIGKGWRQNIEQRIGGTKGCTHLRELLQAIGTVAFQTIPSYRAHMSQVEQPVSVQKDIPPYYLGKCMSWDLNGAVVERHFPMHFAGSKGQVVG